MGIIKRAMAYLSQKASKTRGYAFPPAIKEQGVTCTCCPVHAPELKNCHYWPRADFMQWQGNPTYPLDHEPFGWRTVFNGTVDGIVMHSPDKEPNPPVSKEQHRMIHWCHPLKPCWMCLNNETQAEAAKAKAFEADVKKAGFRPNDALMQPEGPSCECPWCMDHYHPKDEE